MQKAGGTALPAFCFLSTRTGRIFLPVSRARMHARVTAKKLHTLHSLHLTSVSGSYNCKNTGYPAPDATPAPMRVRHAFFKCGPLMKKCGLPMKKCGLHLKKCGPLFFLCGPHRNVPGPGTFLSRPLFSKWRLTLGRIVTLGRICNPTVLSIRTCSPIIALQMLILSAAGLQIRPSQPEPSCVAFYPTFHFSFFTSHFSLFTIHYSLSPSFRCSECSVFILTRA